MTLRQNSLPADTRWEKIINNFPLWKPAVALVVALLWYAGAAFDLINFTVDDTFIPLRYAENAAHGLGLVFNAGERVEGYSNFLWTVMLACAANAGITQSMAPLALVLFAKFAGIACAVATIGLTAWLLVEVQRAGGAKKSSPIYAVALLALPASVSFDAWSTSGMETLMCAMFVTLAGVVFWRGLAPGTDDKRSGQTALLCGGIVFALAAMTRVEQTFVWALLIGAMMWRFSADDRKRIIPSVIVTGVILIFFYGWRFYYYGTLLPNSAVAKSFGNIASRLDGVRYGFAALAATVGVASIGILGVGKLFRTSAQWKFLTLYVASQLVFVFASGSDWMPGCRFLVPAIPLLWVLVAAGLNTIIEENILRVRKEFVALLLCFFLVGAFFHERSIYRFQTAYQTGVAHVEWVTYRNRIDIAKTLQSIIPAGSTLAIGECGMIPYFFPEAKVFDVFGLMDPAVARLPGNHFAKLTAAMFLERHPDYYLMMAFAPGYSFSDSIVPTHPDGVTMMASAEFRNQYEAIQYFDGFALFKKKPTP